jgi:hypothetical protein
LSLIFKKKNTTEAGCSLISKLKLKKEKLDLEVIFFLKNAIKDYYPTQENNTYTSQNAKILHSENSAQLPELEARSKAPCPTPLQGRKELCVCQQRPSSKTSSSCS